MSDEMIELKVEKPGTVVVITYPAGSKAMAEAAQEMADGLLPVLTEGRTTVISVPDTIKVAVSYPPAGEAKVADYQVAHAETPRDLATAVRTLLLDGWKPQGGVAVAYGPLIDDGRGELGYVETYAQAMVRP